MSIDIILEANLPPRKVLRLGQLAEEFGLGSLLRRRELRAPRVLRIRIYSRKG